jgi:hypothetical protein
MAEDECRDFSRRSITTTLTMRAAAIFSSTQINSPDQIAFAAGARRQTVMRDNEEFDRTFRRKQSQLNHADSPAV